MTKKKNLNRVIAYGIMAMFIFCGILVACSKGKTNTPVVKADEGVKYEQSTDIFPNPERGFTKTFSIRNALDPVSLKTFRTPVF